MNLELSPEAAELGRVVRSAIDAAGGDQLVQDVEAAPASRHDRVDRVLAPLGVWELRPADDAVELEAAAETCRVAGWFALPYPVAERLARADDDHELLIVVGGQPFRAPVADIPLRMEAATLDGRRADVVGVGQPLGTKLGSLVSGLELGPWRASTDDVVALPLVLSSWTLLGMTERALELVRRHVLERQQFERRLADFQGVQFQLTDASVAVQGLQELSRYALWSLHTDAAAARVDALALRATALEASSIVFRIAHQLHGAIGFCDEHMLSWLSRHSQPLRRLPLNASETDAALLAGIEDHGLTGLFAPSSAAYRTA